MTTVITVFIIFQKGLTMINTIHVTVFWLGEQILQYKNKLASKL